jgi:uncharacterized protein (DUF342 family)
MSAADSQTTKRELIKITVSKDAMSASVFLRKPNADEEAITLEMIMNELALAEITYGIDQEAIRKVVEDRTYHTPVKVAVGTPPKRGADASFVYQFDTTDEHRPQVDDDGRIDYHDINLIQSVEAESILVRKIPPTVGQSGTNVHGEDIPGLSGRDTPFSSGANTKVSDDGLELFASASGAILFRRGRVAINDVLTISGDVDFNVGNIDCRGSVRVTGDIKPGFNLKIDGDLEVIGHVEDASINVNGNIMVKGGFFGNGQGSMHADGDIVVKYVEGQTVTCGGTLHVGGELNNCQVTAKERVILKGRLGKIIGGDVRAGKEIRCIEAGTDTGTRTNLYVAYDRELMTRHRETIKEIARLESDGERIAEALYGLYRLQVDGKLSDEKEEALAKLEAFRKEIPENIEMLRKQQEELEAALAKYLDAEVIVDGNLYSGVRAHFGVVYRDILEDVSQCKLTLEGSQIMLSDLRGS